MAVTERAEKVSQADFARLHEVSRKTVTVWKQKGLLVLQGKLVDVAASDELLRQHELGRFLPTTENDSPDAEENESDARALEVLLSVSETSMAELKERYS